MSTSLLVSVSTRAKARSSSSRQRFGSFTRLRSRCSERTRSRRSSRAGSSLSTCRGSVTPSPPWWAFSTRWIPSRHSTACLRTSPHHRRRQPLAPLRSQPLRRPPPSPTLRPTLWRRNSSPWASTRTTRAKHRRRSQPRSSAGRATRIAV
eukprot:Amastigsp_a599_23.p3 type:complete len:150 gc:universal Amastigsp_a599_23:561-112(-)